MKKITFVIMLMALLTSCGHQNKSEIEQQIITYQKQVVAINKKIDALQEKLDAKQKKDDVAKGFSVSVKIQKVVPHIFKHYFEASGEVESVHEAFISPELNGQIVQILAHEGQYVKKGQLLARLDADMIEDNIRELKTSLELATVTFKKQQSLWAKHIGSEIQFLQAKNQMESLQNKLASLQTQYEKTFIKSPIDGYVDAIDLKVGEMAVPGIRFIHVVNLKELYINAQISESYLPVMHKGDSVDLGFPAFPQIHLRKSIYRIGKVINKQSRTVEVQLKIKNPDNLLKPNLLAKLTIKDYTNPKAITVPSFLVRKDIQGNYLYIAVRNKDGLIARKRYVKLGKSSRKQLEILKGLNAGDTIVVQGYNNVADGSVLKVLK